MNGYQNTRAWTTKATPATTQARRSPGTQRRSESGRGSMEDVARSTRLLASCGRECLGRRRSIERNGRDILPVGRDHEWGGHRTGVHGVEPHHHHARAAWRNRRFRNTYPSQSDSTDLATLVMGFPSPVTSWNRTACYHM